MNTALLETKSVSKSFGFPALLNVDIQVYHGERFGLIGPNGSGKTTLINVITGILPADGGEVTFDKKDITTLQCYRRARLGIARTFQIPKPFISMSILDNLTIPLRYAAHSKGSKSTPEDEAMNILRLIGIDSKASARPGDLTQIEMRKLELARALALRPKLLLLDEVMAGLSSGEIDELLVTLGNLNEQGITILMIEHIMRAVMSFCERIAVLNAGVKIAEGTPEEIINNKEVERAYLGE
ncbi:MAG: ABC transporter ATP-binding protein [Pseudomonadota bacterium]